MIASWLRRAGQLQRGLGRLSLRARLLLIALGLLAASLAVGNTLVVTLLDRYQIDRIDGQIRPLAELLSTAPYSDTEQPDPEPPGPGVAGQLEELLGFSYVAYLRSDGGIAEENGLASWLSGRPGPVLEGLDAAAVAAHGGEPFNVPGQQGSGRWRVIAVPLEPVAIPPGEEGVSVVVGTSRAEADATVARLRGIVLAVGAGLMVLLAVAGWFAVGGGLRPLRRIEETAAGIAAGDLTRRVPLVSRPRTEIGRLSAALNSMLGQLEAAFAARAASEERTRLSEARMRRFVADVSHELRTPLFGIHGFTELYRMGGLPERADVDRTMDRIERESARLAQLTEDLLLLARLDEHAAGGGLPLEPAPMDVRTLAADAYHDLTALDPTRPLTLTGPGALPGAVANHETAAEAPALVGGGGPAGSAPVLGDEARLRQVVANLVGNAVAHTPPGTAVRIGVGAVDDEAVLELADQGPGMTAEQAERVFDRFYRADDSRTRSGGGGAGLGLAIAQSLVEAHGGRIELATAPGQGATFRMVLPLAST